MLTEYDPAVPDELVCNNTFKEVQEWSKLTYSLFSSLEVRRLFRMSW